MNPTYDFGGQVAVVTGAGAGMGLDTARAFAAAGAAVVLADVNQQALRIATWVIRRVGAAPCQWFSPGSKNTRSPGRITSSAPPRRWHRPMPSVT